jgi:hypothetical protein
MLKLELFYKFYNLVRQLLQIIWEHQLKLFRVLGILYDILNPLQTPGM